MIHVLRTSERDATKGARLFLTLQGDTAAQCEQLVTAKMRVPYGAMFTDEHHGTCWRYAHALQLAGNDSEARIATDDVERIPHVPYNRPGRKILR